MKQLIWKELWEYKLVPVACGILTPLLIAMWDAVTRWRTTSDGNQNWSFSIDETYMVAMFALLLTPLVTGAATFASEQGQGTLAFLRGLPVSSSRLWLAKVVAGLSLSVAGLLLVGIALSLTDLGVFGSDGVVRMWREFGSALPSFIGFIVYVYFVGLTVSLSVDRAISAIALALLVAAGYFVCCNYWLNYVSVNVGQFVPSVFVVVCTFGAFITASFVGFCKGGSTRTRAKQWFGPVALAIWVIAGATGSAVWASMNRPAERGAIVFHGFVPTASYGDTMVFDAGPCVAGHTYGFAVVVALKSVSATSVAVQGTQELSVQRTIVTKARRDVQVFMTYSPTGRTRSDVQVVKIRQLSKPDRTGLGLGGTVVAKLEFHARVLGN